METNTELLNRIEAHIKGRLAVAESRAASSELYEGKKIAYTSILGFVNSLRTELAAQAQLTPSDIEQEAARKYADEQLAGHNRELAESGHTRHFEMGYVCFAGYEIEAAFADGMLAERERLMKEAPVADVIEMQGSTGPFMDYPFMLSLGFRKIPKIEYHGGKVRVIIEEIKEEGK